MVISSISLSGMQAAQVQLQSAANNIANVQTPGYKRQEVIQETRSQGGVKTSVTQTLQENDSIEKDLIKQMQAEGLFKANASIFKATDRMIGTLLNEQA
jgi:flagellar hook-associated protein FlgK